MNCLTCGYALWNLRTRQCPECGRGFRPSDYRFIPGAVRFRCPHCDHGYVGNDETGLPSPPEFSCSTCGNQISVEAMILSPAEGYAPERTAQSQLPWIDRRSRGLFSAFFATIGAALTRPAPMMRNLPLNTPTGDVLAFGCTVALLSLLAGVLPLVWMALWWEYQWYFDGLETVVFFGVLVIGGLLLAAGIVPVMGILTHLCLRLTGGCAYSVDRTLQAFGFASGASVACAVPCLGWVFGWFWWVASTIAAVAFAQRVHPARAALAVLALPLLLAGGLTATGVIAHRKYAAQSTQWDDPVVQITSALWQMNWQQGALPRHGLELFIYSPWQVDPMQRGAPFCHPSTRTTPSAIPVGDGTLQDLLGIAGHARARAIHRHVDAMPEKVIAHRVGDYIFTHHGLAAAPTFDANLWFVVMLPDPDSNPAPAADDEIFIASVDHTRNTITYAELDTALTEQNEYRKLLGLPPLPDLRTITHDAPALEQQEAENGSDP